MIHKLKYHLKNHLPSLSEIQAFYGLIVMLIYGWSLYWYIWVLPSWVQFLTPGEIWGILWYTLAVNFIETLTLISAIVALCIVLPKRWLRDDFLWRASSIVIAPIFFLMILLARNAPLSSLPKYGSVAFLAFFAIQFLAARFKFFRSALYDVAERSIIFMYISIPASLLAIVVLVFRNI
jgi:hypothetical protein